MSTRAPRFVGLAVAAGMLLAVPATVASAAFPGLNLGWGAFCPTNISSMYAVTDPCDGSSELAGVRYILIGSVVVPSPAPSACMAEVFFVELEETAPQLSDYWHLEDENQPAQINVAGCRGTAAAGPYAGNLGSLTVQVSDPSFPPVFTGCTKFWGNSPTGAINYGVLIPDAYPGINDPRRGRLIGHFEKSPGTAMTAGLQYGVFVATIDTNHQIIDPANPPAYVCAGCQDEVVIVFNEVDLYQPPGTPGGDIIITNESSRRWVTWQPGATPAHRATWGQVKSQYR